MRVNNRQIEAKIKVLNDYFANNGIGLRITEECSGSPTELNLTEIKGSHNVICSYDGRTGAFQALSRFLDLLYITELKDIRKIKRIFDCC
jgi:hypothetical protein